MSDELWIAVLGILGIAISTSPAWLPYIFRKTQEQAELTGGVNPNGGTHNDPLIKAMLDDAERDRGRLERVESELMQVETELQTKTMERDSILRWARKLYRELVRRADGTHPAPEWPESLEQWKEEED